MEHWRPLTPGPRPGLGELTVRSVAEVVRRSSGTHPFGVTEVP
jgi:hypothetical protein